MSTYIIGDVHGCLDGLLSLIAKANIQPTDQLIFLGDLVNKGVQNEAVLNWLTQQTNCKTVLGNHDLYILNQLVNQPSALSQTAEAIKRMPNHREITEWLLHQQLILTQDKQLFCHAGIHPTWQDNLIEEIINQPQTWINPQTLKLYFQARWLDLSHQDPLFILAACTEMRFLNRHDLTFAPGSEDNKDIKANKIAWFEVNPQHSYTAVFFGHWARLSTVYNGKAICLDGGYVYGGQFFCYDLNNKNLIILKS